MESDSECVNPLFSVTKIDPKEIPEVTNKFLMRDERPRDDDNRDRDNDRGRDRGERNFGWSKKSVPQSRSGRVIKGRGNFRYRTPTRSSRSRSRSFTPEHWKVAQRNLIKMTDFEKLEEEKKRKEEEIKRRAEERKKRHDAFSQGDGKKTFYELSHEVTVGAVVVEISTKEPEKSSADELDYEAEEVVENDVVSVKKKDDVKIDRHRSENNSRVQKRSRSREFDRRNRDRRDVRDYRDKRNDDGTGRRFDRFDRNNRFDNRNRRTSDRDRTNDRDRKKLDRSRSRSR